MIVIVICLYKDVCTPCNLLPTSLPGNPYLVFASALLPRSLRQGQVGVRVHTVFLDVSASSLNNGNVRR